MAKLGSRVTSAERGTTIERLLDLPWRDRREIYQLLGASLGLPHDDDGEGERQRELAGRAEALDAMRAAAEHLSLPDGSRLAVRDYDRAQQKLGLGLSSAAVIRRWGAWREAVDVMQGMRAKTTARQRAHWRAVNSSVRTHEQHLAGVRAWLEGEPSAVTKRAYDDWALDCNEQYPESVPLVTADAMANALALPWRTLLGVVRGERTLAEAQRERLLRLRADGGSLGLVGVAYVALLHKTSERLAHKLVRKGGFPVPVAYTTMNKRQAWYRRDVEAHRAGRRVPLRKLFEAQEKVILSEEVRAMLGQSEMDFRRTVTRSQEASREEVPRESLLPRPDGRVNHALYWLRADIEAWDERRQRKD
jgi:hypothetical protein